MRFRYRVAALLFMAAGLTLGGCGQKSKPAPSKPGPTAEAKAPAETPKKEAAEPTKAPAEAAKKEAAANLVVLQVKGMV